MKSSMCVLLAVLIMGSTFSIATLNPVSAQTATTFSVTGPTSAYACCPVQFTVTAQDSIGNTITGYSGTVNFTCTDPMAILPADSSSLTNGVGTFNVTLESVGSQTVTVTDSADTTITGTSATVAVAPIHFIFGILTSPINQGCKVQYAVLSKDSSNNTITTYGGTLNFTSSDASAILPSGAPTLTNGIGDFSAYFGTSGLQTITVTDSLNAATSSQSDQLFVVPTHLSMTISKSSISAGSTITVNVTALDPSNNNVAVYASTASYGGVLEINSTDSQANYTANANCNLIAGTGTFDITLNTVGSQTITVTDSDFPAIAATSSSITVNPVVSATPSESPTSTPEATTAPTATPTTTLTATNSTAALSPTASPSPTQSTTILQKPKENGLPMAIMAGMAAVIATAVIAIGLVRFKRSKNPTIQQP